MAKAPPSFAFYPSDFLGGTQHMTPEEVGAYLRILCYQWANGAVPRDSVKLSRICVCSLEEMQRIWPGIADKFVASSSDGEMMVNPRMEIDRQSSMGKWEANVTKKKSDKKKAKDVSEARRMAGKRGAEARWQNDGKNGKKPGKKWQNDGKTIANSDFAIDLPSKNDGKTDGKTSRFPQEKWQNDGKNGKPEEGKWKKEGGILNLSGDVTRKPTHTQNAHASDRDDRDLQKEPDRQTTKPPAEPERGEFVWRSTVNGRVSKFRIDEAHDTPKFRESLGLWLESIEIDTGAAVNAIRIQVQLSNLSTQCPDAKSASEALIRSMTQAAKPGQVYYHPLPERAPGAKFGAQDRSEQDSRPNVRELIAKGVI